MITKHELKLRINDLQELYDELNADFVKLDRKLKAIEKKLKSCDKNI